MASSSAGSGLTFKLHPLVIVNISDHHTRVKAQTHHTDDGSGSSGGSGGAATAVRVFGCVIGVQRGRTVEIFNSFELLYDPLTHSLDRSFLEKKQELYKKTVEAERISVDHVAHLKPSDGGSAATQLAAHLTGIHSAIKMLNSRIRIIHQYLVAMQKGEVPLDNSILRQVSSLLRRLPAMESEKFQDDFLMEYNETLLVAYLAMLTNCSSTLNDLVDKFNAIYDRHTKRGGRTAFI